MAAVVRALTAVAVRNQKKPGMYCDGRGLYLKVARGGTKSWIFRWRDRVSGQLRDKGLGSVFDVTLEQARVAAGACRQQVRDGSNPIDVAKQRIQMARLERAKQMTFGECAGKYIEAHRAGWDNSKHAAQWANTLATHAALLTDLPVSAIDTALVVKCLDPIWATKTETATRVRQRIEAVLDWATVRKLRVGDNPARWRGHLDKLLAKPEKLKRVRHRPALPFSEIGSYMAILRGKEGNGARALELQILTACRPGEVAGARWEEIDLDAALWTIPAPRMKARRDHTVPLAPAAVELLRAQRPGTSYVFPSTGKAGFVTTAAMLKAGRCVRDDIDLTSHGFRSTFRDWAAEETTYAGEIVEMALAHSIKNKTEAAYRRGDLLEKRRHLMTAWAKRCAQLDAAPTTNVTPIGEARKARV